MSKAKTRKAPPADHWGMYNTSVGFVIVRADRIKEPFIAVQRACSSRAGERRKWYAIQVITPHETVSVEVTPRKTIVNRKDRK